MIFRLTEALFRLTEALVRLTEALFRLTGVTSRHFAISCFKDALRLYKFNRTGLPKTEEILKITKCMNFRIITQGSTERFEAVQNQSLGSVSTSYNLQLFRNNGIILSFSSK